MDEMQAVPMVEYSFDGRDFRMIRVATGLVDVYGLDHGKPGAEKKPPKEKYFGRISVPYPYLRETMDGIKAAKALDPAMKALLKPTTRRVRFYHEMQQDNGNGKGQ